MVGAMSKYDAQRAFEIAQVASVDAQNRIYRLRQSGKASPEAEAISDLARAVNALATGLKELSE